MAVFLDSLPQLQAEVLSIAHRGNSLFAPENTLASSFAAQGKADWVEFDVRVSSDGQLVLMHDATVDRTTDGSGAVSGLTLAQLKLLDAGSWFSASFTGERIPLLAEMITNTLPFAVPLIEHKAGSASAYVSELQRLGAITNVVLQSFDWNFLAGVYALEPRIRLCALGSGALDATMLTTITNTGARTVAWEKASVTPALVKLVHDWGMALFVWTVDSSAEIQNFMNLGVNGIISRMIRPQ
jgi:glycerophosphoryl diester phosphodiesterase